MKSYRQVQQERTRERIKARIRRERDIQRIARNMREMVDMHLEMMTASAQASALRRAERAVAKANAFAIDPDAYQLPSGTWVSRA